MRGVWLLAVRHAVHNRVATVVLVLCIGVVMFLPWAAEMVVSRFQSELTSRAAHVPLVAGAKGSKFDLALSTMFFRESELATIPMSELREIQGWRMGVAVGVSTRFTAHGWPLVGVGREYFERQGLEPSEGTLPLVMGDVVLGSDAAEALGLGAGDVLFSDQRELYDIAKPPALKMRVCGVLAPMGTPDDMAAFVDLKTTWLLEGIAHGHVEATSVDRAMVIGETEGQVVLSPALIEANEVTSDNLASFHMHADDSGLPLTSILFYPEDERAATIIKARVNRSDAYQMVSATGVMDELLAYVFRVKALLDSLSVVLGACTVVLTGLVVTLSLRLRARELEALHRIGCSRFTTVRLVGAELGVILLASAGLAAAGVLVAGAIVGNAIWVIG